MRRWQPVFALTALGALVRLPFWLAALRLSVDGDTAIVGLMARHGLTSATFWGQPYGSPLDAWVAAPCVALLGNSVLAVRLPAFALGLALVPLAYWLAARLHPAAAAPAGLLLACPPAYLLLLAALPPPLYPTTLALLAALLLGALRLADEASGASSRAALCAWGLAAGLALWTHLVALAVVVPAGAWLVWRRGPSRGVLAPLLGGVALASAPWWTRLAYDPSATSVLSATGDDAGTTLSHLGALLPRLHEPLLGLLGAHTPTTADDPLDHVGLPALGVAALALLYLTGLARAGMAARRAWRSGSPACRGSARAALLLAGALLLTVLAFPWPLRAGPETLRFLSPGYVPLAVLVAWGAVADGRRRGAWPIVLGLAALHLLPAARLWAAWSAATPERPLLPDCRPALRLLEERGLRHAWASYDTAWCLTYLSDERVLASQPWNERFPGAPLLLRERVRAAREAAWVLQPGADFDLPSPARFEAFVSGTGGRLRRTDVGASVVYDRFVAPFADHGWAPREAPVLGDGDLTSGVTEPGHGPATWSLDTPATMAALTLIGSPDGEGLPHGLALEVSTDGRTFERVARLRPGQRVRELVWANGQPQARDDLDAFTLAFTPRRVFAWRLTPRPAQGPWRLCELRVHAPRDGSLETPSGAGALVRAWLETRRMRSFSHRSW